MQDHMNLKKTRPCHFIFKDGKVHFSKELERKVFFFMTMAMLLAGVCVKLGVF